MDIIYILIQLPSKFLVSLVTRKASLGAINFSQPKTTKSHRKPWRSKLDEIVSGARQSKVGPTFLVDLVETSHQRVVRTDHSPARGLGHVGSKFGGFLNAHDAHPGAKLVVSNRIESITFHITY